MFFTLQRNSTYVIVSCILFCLVYNNSTSLEPKISQFWQRLVAGWYWSFKMLPPTQGFAPETEICQEEPERAWPDLIGYVY